MSAERFYGAQKMTRSSMILKTGPNKPKRRLKADVVSDIEKMLKQKIPGLEKATMNTLTTMEEAIKNMLINIKGGKDESKNNV